MEQMIIYALEVLACILVTIAIFYGGSKLFELIISKVKDGPFKDLLKAINEIFIAAVKKAYQTEVEALKLEGKFNAEAQEKVKQDVLEEIVGKLTPKMKKAIEKRYGDVYEYTSDHIEEVIYSLKRSKRPVVICR